MAVGRVHFVVFMHTNRFLVVPMAEFLPIMLA